MLLSVNQILKILTLIQVDKKDYE